MIKKVGKSTIKLSGGIGITAGAAVAGKKEAQGPLGQTFDKIFDDTSMGSQSWEKAEGLLLKESADRCIAKSGIAKSRIGMIFAGDLLNQCTGAALGLKDIGIPFAGVFGACSTMALSIINAAVFVESGAAEYALAATSSHFCSAERQFRFPLEYGGQRPPSAQWTVTGAGCSLIGPGASPKIQHISIGKITDLGITDSNSMGAAMAPAAASTIGDFLSDTGLSTDSFDLILTGDLGRVGSDLLYQLLDREELDIRKKHADCGVLIYSENQEDVNSGGSGCGCAASVLNGYILNRMREGRIKNILFTATGALMSPTTVQQGESIPGIAHLLHLTV